MRIYMLLIFIVVGVVPLGLFSSLLLGNYENRTISNRMTDLQNRANILGNMLQKTGYLTMAEVPEIETEVARMAEIYRGKILIINNNLNIVNDSYGLETGKYLISKEVLQCFNGVINKNYDKENQYIRIVYPIKDTLSVDTIGVIIMNSSTKDVQVILNSLEQRAVLFLITLSVIIVAFAIYFSGKLIKPLTSVVSSIDRLTEGFMDEKLSIKGYYEVEKISDSFNHMVSRLQKLENSRQEFVSNVSHELKTPITSIKVLADSLIMQEDAPVELYREFLTDITDEIERENKIINDLLSLVKLDKTAGDMNITTININELLEQILKRLRPIAKKRNIEMIFESFRPVIAEVDEVKLSLAISNLIENAVKYNVEDGWVRVSLNADHKYFYVKISDSGIGIPEEAQDFIFERFYRVDKARSRESGGTGLGLAITKNVIQMHRGAIKVYSKESEGTTFNVRIPLNYIA